MFKKWVLLIVVTFVFFVGLSHAVLQSRFISNEIARFSEARLGNILGQKLSIGAARLHLFSASVSLEDIAFLSGSPNEPPSFLAKEIRVFVSPGSIFTKVFIIRKIELDSPTLELSSSYFGTLPFLNKPQTINQDETSTSPAVIIREISINDGDFTFKGGKFLEEFSLTKVETDIKSDFKMSHFEVQLIAAEGAFSAGGIDKTFSQIEGEMLVQPDRIDLERGHITSGKADLHADGAVYFRPESPFDLNLELRLPIDMIAGQGSRQSRKQFFQGTQPKGDVTFLGKLTGSVPDPVFEGEISVPNVVLGDKDVGSVKADLLFREKTVFLSALSGVFFSGPFSGEAKLVLAASPEKSEKRKAAAQFNVNLQYEDLPIDQIIKAAPLGERNLDHFLKGLFATGNLSLSGSDIRPDTLQARGRMRIKRLPLFSPSVSVGGKPLHQLIARLQGGRVTWDWSNAGLLLEEGEFSLLKTQLSFQGKWDLLRGLVLDTTLTSQNIGELAEIVHFPLTGGLQAGGRFTSQGDLPAFEGGLLLESGKLRGQEFSRFSSELDLRGRKVNVKNAILEIPEKKGEGSRISPPGSYRAQGNLDLTNLKLPDFDFEVKIKSGNPQEVFHFYKLKIPLYAAASGALRIKGIPKSFFVKGSLALSEGSLYGEHFDQGSVDLTVTGKEVLFKNVVLRKKKSILSGKGGIGYDKSFQLAIKGDRLRIQETRFLKWMPPSLTGSVGLVVSGKGSLKNPELHFVAAIKDLNYSELEGVRGTVKADWLDHVVDFEGNFPHENISLTGEVRLAPLYPFLFEGRFERFRIDPLLKGHLSGPIGDVALRASGQLTGSGKLFQLDRVNLSGALSELTAVFSDYKVKNDGPVAIQAKGGTFTFKGTRFKGENTALVLNGELNLMKDWNLFLNGEADLDLITFFSENVTTGRGRALLDLAITDQWKSPRIRGDLTLKGGSIRTTRLSQPIQISSLKVLFNERQVILEDFHGRVGGGDFFATGKSDLIGFSINDFGFFIDINRVRMDLSEGIPATIDGELFFQRKGLNQTLKGDLILRNVSYEENVDLKKLVGDAIQKPEFDTSGETPVIGKTKVNIHLYGDEEIWIANNLAKIPLVVDLFVKGTFDDPKLMGRVDLSNGEITFGENTFRVISGSVDFLDPEEIDPIFDLTARTSVRSIVTDRKYNIDLNLSGTLSQITLTWNSFPSLPEVDILALLTIRKTTADLVEIKGGAGTEVTNFVVGEVLSAPIDQLTGLVGDPVEKITGIDHIRVDPYVDGANASTTAGTRLTAEKRLLKDRLVVIYTTTLDPSEEELIRMVYEVSKNISLVGKRDSYGQVGGDIRFRFEFR